MGNTNCVADGGCPHRADILITNNTKHEIKLDLENGCGRDCDHKGWQVLDGKIIEGHEPPKVILPYSTGNFSVSGREGTAVAPKGKVFYSNEEVNLKLIFEWNASGWTSPLSTNAASIVITGIPKNSGGFFSKTPKPWNQVLVGECDHMNWTFEVREKEGTIAEAQKTAKNLQNVKMQL